MSQLAKAATWSTALWGGRFNPVLPLHDKDTARNLVRTFAVDILIPVVPTDEAREFGLLFPYLISPPFWGEQVFRDRQCNFVDIRHAVLRTSKQILARMNAAPPRLVRSVWQNEDPLSTLFHLLFGQYPDPDEIGINYSKDIVGTLQHEVFAIGRDRPVPAQSNSINLLDLTGLEIQSERDPSGWLAPGVLLGSATDFDDLVLFWNLRAAGAKMAFYDVALASRLTPYAKAFVESQKKEVGSLPRLNIWSREEPLDSDLELTDVEIVRCRGGGEGTWNGMNVRPSRVRFSLSHRDVIASYEENEGTAQAFFALPGLPFDEQDFDAHRQHFVVTVQASQFGPARDDFTFSTPFLPHLNEFYGRSFHFNYAETRVAPSLFGGGAIGIFETVGTQRLQVNAIGVQDFIRVLFDSFRDQGHPVGPAGSYLRPADSSIGRSSWM